MPTYLFTTTIAVAQEYCAKLNAMCGYPDMGTLTFQATEIAPTKDGYSVIVPDGLWAPKIRKYIDCRSVLPVSRQADNPIAVVSNVKPALDAAAALPDATEPDLVTKQAFVLVNQVCQEKLIVTAVQGPPDEP